MDIQTHQCVYALSVYMHTLHIYISTLDIHITSLYVEHNCAMMDDLAFNDMIMTPRAVQYHSVPNA